ncbi:DNA internalization-related competence protein ComEC/Rec2 [Vibrio sp. MA40-2]|uniref:DNA internalization-related competence protein ComEC/Rec2 n=1 Tax=Vibrio sp. MA40-2 TaxID=3391828 RepID=UPI0039A460E6
MNFLGITTMTLFGYHWNIVVFIVTTLTFPYWPFPPVIQSVVVLLVLTIASYQISQLYWLRGLLLALISVSVHSYYFQMKIDTTFREGNDTTIVARVDSFFKKITHGNEYILRFESINGDKIPFVFQPSVKVVTSESLKLLLGEQWRLQVKIKPVYGRLNESGFDQERYFISQGLYAKGKVIDERSAIRLQVSSSWRFKLYQNVRQHIKGTTNQAILLALSFGERSLLTKQNWQQLKNSGLIHLVAISGLHIGIAYLFGWKVGCMVRLLLTNWFSAPLVFALVTASSYAWLAGFSLSTLRALYMCALFGFFSYFGLKFNVLSILLWTMAVLLLIDPFSVLSVSFWLSFLSVASIYVLSTLRSLHQVSLVKKMMIMQFSLTLIMLPVSALIFTGFSLSSCLYNLIFIPWFSFIVVPLIFVALGFSLLVPFCAGYIWQIVDLLLIPVSWSISFANMSWINIGYHNALLIVAAIGFGLIKPLLTVKSSILFGFSLLFISLSIGFKSKSEWQLSMLDVGHGLAILIEKNQSYLLYDTGNKWENGSIAESVIEPILRYRGINRLDMLIISHTDSDHAGGKEHIEQVFNPVLKLSSQAIDGYLPCVDGQTWNWQGLIISALWPPRIVTRAYNPHSCVIKISDGVSSVLLTGDIETIGELLLAQNPAKIRSDIMLVPHHGSKTSSTDLFLDAIKPTEGMASIALGNQWNLPNREVLERYEIRDIMWLDTGREGQISLNFTASGWETTRERQAQYLHWYRQKLRKRVE